ncbi:G-type lectin S-receptor-like serine/threonine-protein kinase LECRK1 [Macadamia integrifolia]|uniref:G-type lectin S-receptor-like serine/threonine-protein kinase LECRK1 n=1 Tax=Macadamia integrifolia TaxID=60698 RepID=UPI001C4F582C|nr:G-type lectin S-receptor-like serine/threonine-protein kinase LECRK1 [Macadamia integrifolia]
MADVATFVFLLLLSSVLYLSAVLAAHEQRSSNISLGSSLSPSSTNSSWLSPSGRFAFGFYPQGNGFAIGIWFAQIPQLTVVWTSNRDDPPLSSNATLLLTSNGRLILQDTQEGQEKSIADDLQSASWASMLDTGNFVLYDSSGNSLWESFDHFPTDTLLPGERQTAICSIPGYNFTKFVNGSQDSLGRCKRKLNAEGCGNETMSILENTTGWVKHIIYKIIASTAEGECTDEACLRYGSTQEYPFYIYAFFVKIAVFVANYFILYSARVVVRPPLQ